MVMTGIVQRKSGNHSILYRLPVGLRQRRGEKASPELSVREGERLKMPSGITEQGDAKFQKEKTNWVIQCY
jgi:hypothetical protein